MFLKLKGFFEDPNINWINIEIKQKKQHNDICVKINHYLQKRKKREQIQIIEATRSMGYY